MTGLIVLGLIVALIAGLWMVGWAILMLITLWEVWKSGKN